MFLIYANISHFAKNLNEFLNWPKFDEDYWNYQMIPVHLKAVSILQSEAKKFT